MTMWARHMELALALWLMISPFALRHDAAETGLWLHDLCCAAVILAVSLLSHWRAARRIHLAILPLAAWLIGAGWWQTAVSGSVAQPAHENWILVGMVLAMLSVVPSEANLPPPRWRRRLER